MSVNIHGKEYITVAERVQEAHNTGGDLSIFTEVLFQEPVVIKATVATAKGTFTGISAANPNKTIEAQSPYEVAETSAVGRALGFAGYGAVEGIASADEVVKAESTSKYASQKDHFCKTHQRDLKFKQTPNGIIWEHYAQIDGVWNTCHGDGTWRPQQAKAEVIPEDDVDEETDSYGLEGNDIDK